MPTSSLTAYFLGVYRRTLHPTIELRREHFAVWAQLDASER